MKEKRKNFVSKIKSIKNQTKDFEKFKNEMLEKSKDIVIHPFFNRLSSFYKRKANVGDVIKIKEVSKLKKIKFDPASLIRLN